MKQYKLTFGINGMNLVRKYIKIQEHKEEDNNDYDYDISIAKQFLESEGYEVIDRNQEDEDEFDDIK